MFKNFCEFDIFGFDEIEAKKQEVEVPSDEDLPIISFNVEWMMDSLSRYKLGSMRAKHDFSDEVIWGDKQPGAIRACITPNGNFFIDRMCIDLHGNVVWICKKTFRIDFENWKDKEDLVAKDMFEEVRKISFQQIDRADSNYEDLPYLTKRLAGRLKAVAPELFMYEDIKEINKDYFIIYFSLRGAGVGKIARRFRRSAQTPEATIDIKYYRNRGYIRMILTTVSVGGEGQGWEIDIPYLDANFMPSQHKEEIVQAITTALKYY